MDIKLSYVPPVKKSFFIILGISFFAVFLILYILFSKFGLIVMIIFSLLYAFLMLFQFLSLTKKYTISVKHEEQKIIVSKPFKKIEMSLKEVNRINIVLENNSYILVLYINSLEHRYTLSGSLSFEEPLLIPFLRKCEELNPNLVLDEYAHNILHGGEKFNPWSNKMYTSYWTYILSMITYYVALLILLNIFK